MSELLNVWVPCNPPRAWGKNSKRAFVRGNHAVVVEGSNIKNTKEFLFGVLAGEYHGGMSEEPLKLSIQVFMQKPKSVKRHDCTVAPDIDGIATTVMDVLERLGFYKNDSQIIELSVRKSYEHPFDGSTGIKIELEELL